MKSSKQQQPLREAWTFFGDCLACWYAWKSVTEWEQRHRIYSHAWELVGQQQRVHYDQALANFVHPRGSMFGDRWESAGVVVSADGDVNVYVRRSAEGWVKDQESLYKNKLHGKSSASLLRNMNATVAKVITLEKNTKGVLHLNLCILG